MKSDSKYEWVIIGAGPHGVHLAASLVEGGVPISQILLVDRFPRPLYRWSRQTSRLRMGYLRSSAVHHLGPSPWSLIEFAQLGFGKPSNWSAPPYQRPAYEVFQQHCDFIIAEFSIDQLFRQSRVNAIHRTNSNSYSLQTEDGSLESRRVILSIGQASPHRPDWTRDHSQIQHLLSTQWNDVNGRVAVVGSGMTACQFCLANLGKFEKLYLVSPNLPSLSDFDADPCWIGPKCRTPAFERLPVEEKRRLIKRERRPGSVNETVHKELLQALDSGQIEFRQGRASGMTGDQLRLNSGELLTVDQVVLGTGFEKVRPGGAFVDELIKNLSLPVAPCGYPVISEHLEWADGLYVTGGLAELRLGPVSRNLTGGRSAAKLILEHFTHHTSKKEKTLA